MVIMMPIFATIGIGVTFSLAVIGLSYIISKF